jgi:hypothetical protein
VEAANTQQASGIAGITADQVAKYLILSAVLAHEQLLAAELTERWFGMKRWRVSGSFPIDFKSLSMRYTYTDTDTGYWLVVDGI